MERQKSILDAVQDDANAAEIQARDTATSRRLDEYLSSVRDPGAFDRESAAGVRTGRGAAAGRRRPEDWPRIAKLQSDLLVHALASRPDTGRIVHADQVPGTLAFPWLGHTSERHHEYTHGQVETPRDMRILRDICRWHVEEFAYLVGQAEVHARRRRHAARSHLPAVRPRARRGQCHKNNNLAVIVAGHAGGLKTGMHTRTTGTLGDLYLTLSDEVMQAGVGKFPTAGNKLSAVV